MSARAVLAGVAAALGCLIAPAGAVPVFPPETHFLNDGGAELPIVACAPLAVCTIFLPSGAVLNTQHPIEVGDSDKSHWVYDVGTAGGRWFVAAKPVAEHLSTTLQINALTAIYVVRLTSQSFVRFPLYAFADEPPPPTPSPTIPPSPRPMIAAEYRVTGWGAFKPLTVQTDGERTYLTLPGAAVSDAPTVSAIDASGQEYPVHVVPPAHVGSSLLVIDGVPTHLVLLSGPGKRDERVDVVRVR